MNACMVSMLIDALNGDVTARSMVVDALKESSEEAGEALAKLLNIRNRVSDMLEMHRDLHDELAEEVEMGDADFESHSESDHEEGVIWACEHILALLG